jgi:hypothetical protein
VRRVHHDLLVKSPGAHGAPCNVFCQQIIAMVSCKHQTERFGQASTVTQ